MPMAAPEQLVTIVLPPQTFYALVPKTRTLTKCGSVPATRVAAELAIPDASTPTPEPDGLHPIVAKVLGKDSGFIPTVYLKNGNQYWVKVRP